MTPNRTIFQIIQSDKIKTSDLDKQEDKMEKIREQEKKSPKSSNVKHSISDVEMNQP